MVVFAKLRKNVKVQRNVQLSKCVSTNTFDAIFWVKNGSIVTAHSCVKTGGKALLEVIKFKKIRGKRGSRDCVLKGELTFKEEWYNTIEHSLNI